MNEVIFTPKETSHRRAQADVFRLLEASENTTASTKHEFSHAVGGSFHAGEISRSFSWDGAASNQPSIQNLVTFEAHAAAFITAAENNNVAVMDSEKRKMLFVFNIPYDRVIKAQQTALLKAAEKDADLSVLYFLADAKKMAGIKGKDWKSAFEAAFITACSHNSTNSAQALLEQAQLEPEIIAWGFYRAPQSGAVQADIVSPAMSSHPAVARIYEAQMNLLDAAVAGNVQAIPSLSDKMGIRTDFVYREAAECAIVSGKEQSLRYLLPHVQPMWLSELANITGREGRPDLIDAIIEHAENPPMPPRDKIDKFTFKIITTSEKPKYPSAKELREEFVKGAASAGKLEDVHTLINSDPPYAREYYYRAAAAAIESQQDNVLDIVLPYVSGDIGGVSCMVNLLELALKRDNFIAAEKIKDQGGGESIRSQHLIELVTKRQLELLKKFLATPKLSPFDVGGALSTLAHRSEQNRTIPFPDSSYVLPLWEHAAERSRVDVLGSFAFANQHGLIKSIVEIDGNASQACVNHGLVNATVGYGRESFDFLLPFATNEGHQQSLKAMIDRSMRVHEMPHYVTALLDASKIDSALLTNAAIKIANNEMHPDRKGQINVPDPSAAVAILKHESFNTAGANTVLTSIGLQGNTNANKAALDAGANPVVSSFYEAVRNKDVAIAERLMPQVPYEALKNAYYYSEDAAPMQVLLLTKALSEEDRDYNIEGALNRGRYEMLSAVIASGHTIKPNYFAYANDEKGMDLLLSMATGKEAALAYLQAGGVEGVSSAKQMELLLSKVAAMGIQPPDFTP